MRIAPAIQKRRHLSAVEKARVVLRQGGRCACGCREKLNVGQIEFDHRIGLAFGGTNDLENFDALVKRHHRRKSNDENRTRAKCDRLRAKHTGQWLSARDRELARIMERTKTVEPRRPRPAGPAA